MAKLVDLVKITCNSTGTGALLLGAAVPGNRGAEALMNGEVYSYSIQQGNNWEFGTATFLKTPPRLIRTPNDSSIGGTALDLKPNAQVSLVALASDIQLPIFGNASTATKLATPRTIGTSGDISWSVSFDGNTNAAGAASITAKAVTNTKLADMPANTIKGVTTAGAPTDLSATAAKALIGLSRVPNLTQGETLAGLTADNVTAAIGGTAATTAYLKGVLGSRQAHVLDISDWDATGTHDNAASYQALINQAAVAAVDVVAGPGKFLMGTTIVLPDGHSFRGKYAAGFQANPAKSSTFLLNHPSYGFTRSGSGGAAISIENQATLRPQPAVGTAAWTPGDYDFDYYFADISDLRMNHISTINPTRGIYFNGGRNQIKDWLGQCFKVGLQIDWSYDTCVFEDFHLWPTWNQAAVLKQYAQDHLVSMRLARVDNPFFSRIFSIWHQAAFEIGFYAGDGPNKPSGTVSKLKLIGADLDIGDTGYLVLPSANGHTAEFHGVTMQARDEVIASALLQVRGPNTVIGGDLTVTGSGGNGVKLETTATGSEIALRTRVETWNRTGAGFPGVEVMAGHFDLLPGSKLTGGNGAPNTSGNVTVWQP